VTRNQARMVVVDIVDLAEDLEYSIFEGFVAVVDLPGVDILRRSFDLDVLLAVHIGRKVEPETLMHPRAFRSLSGI